MAAVVLSAMALLAFDQPAPSKLPPAAERSIDFVKDVRPILASTCYSCHGADKQKSDYRLDLKASALKGGAIGDAILSGKSAESPLIHYVSGLDEQIKMPPQGEPLTAEQIGILRGWIDQGANWPDGADAVPENKADQWAFGPLVKPAVPAVKTPGWGRTPIDAFVLARLEEQGMAPSGPADKRALLRRVTFDLIGLPPTPQELDAFLADGSLEAYAHVVDRLLASPAYGERWARHWMDMVHFAETHGHDQDRPRPNAWPYRDYLIRAFNEDRPYARFVEEQLAGDFLYPDDPQGIVATGFLAAGPWDESSQVNIVEDTVDKKIARNLDRDDMLTTAMATFQSLTVHCARCHDHKFDPISQAEYYSLQSVFAGVDRANRPYDLDLHTNLTRQSLLRKKADLEAGRAVPVNELQDPALLAELAAWEQAFAARSSLWTPLDPVSFTSAEGATPVKQPDDSVLYGGMRPETDTYTIVAHTDLKGITAVRLEVLTDESLHLQGPGRQDNGNLHLSEFKVQAAPRAEAQAGIPVVLQNPTADFDQEGWTVAMAIDSKPETAWGIHPQVGKPHWATFEVKEPLGFDGGTVLTFVLEQKHGRGHLIGRPRLSITTLPPPIRTTEAIEHILAITSEQRTDQQQVELATYVLKSRVLAQLKALPKPHMVYAAATEFTPDGNFTPARGARPIYLLQRGDVNQPEGLVSPSGLRCIPGLKHEFDLPDPNDEGRRRAALAKWITDPANVLTWRSIVNRVWHYHFGRGIVDTPNDFGRMGGRPTHPELLDWLAVNFRDQGGSLKSLHKLIVTSSVYTQSAVSKDEFASIDAGNRYLWRMNRTRLDAESVRDAILQVTGKLDPSMGGPSVKQFIESPGIHVTPMVDYQNFDVDNPASYRRSVYRFLFRTLPDPFMDSLDCADASQLTPARNSSVTALQALSMLNNHFLVRQSEHFAERVGRAGNELAGQIEATYLLALGRPPTAEEVSALSAYAMKHGMANVCRLILNSNEFMFVH
ncbi:MAG: DUF1553 domain-containing protein [Planctomycetaceae bacterium]|nr:DUF1553 domain-containing protein [Planctomycetaceae bacterium]